MSLLSRLIGSDDGVKLSVHSFMAAMAELKRGAPNVTVTSIGDFFGLSAGERTELDTFANNHFGDVITREQIHDVLLLGESGAYTEQQCSDRLIAAGSSNVLPLIVQRELEVIARGINDCVLSGCAVTAQGSPNMTLAVAKGAALPNGVLRAIAAANVNIGASDATKPRFDLVVIDASGAKVVRAGTASPSPTPPAMQANDVALCFVYVKPGVTAITSVDLLDARILNSTGAVTVGKITTPVVFNNTSAAQSYVSLVMPSGLFLTGKVLRVRCGGTMLLNSGTPTVTLRIAYGGTTMFQDVTLAATADVDRLAWSLDFDLIAQGNSDQEVIGVLVMAPMGAKTAPNTGIGDIAANGLSTPFAGAAAIDSDGGDRTLLVQFTMSVQNAANEIVLEYATGELV